MANYLIHKAVNLDAVKKSRKLTIEKMEAEYIAQCKYDGCNMIVVVAEEDGVLKGWAQSRTGEEVKSCDHIIECLTANGMKPGVYLGEVWHPAIPQEQISGAFRRQSEQAPDLHFVVFDYLTCTEFDEGFSPLGYVDRVERLPEFITRSAYMRNPVYCGLSFGRLKDLGWPAQETCDKLVAAGGYDGLILRDPEGTWTAGRGTNGEIVKLKAIVTYDLKVVGTEPGKGKHAGRIGALVVEYNDSVLRVGGGLTDAQRELPESYWLGKIIEVQAMADSAHGLLREPRMKSVRFDKEEADA